MNATATATAPSSPPLILTPDQRLRVFVSSTLQELAEERKAAEIAVHALRHVQPVDERSVDHPRVPMQQHRRHVNRRAIFKMT